MQLLEVKPAKNKSENDPGYYIKAIEGIRKHNPATLSLLTNSYSSFIFIILCRSGIFSGTLCWGDLFRQVNWCDGCVASHSA
jgi:hypothetical protein